MDNINDFVDTYLDGLDPNSIPLVLNKDNFLKLLKVINILNVALKSKKSITVLNTRKKSKISKFVNNDKSLAKFSYLIDIFFDLTNEELMASKAFCKCLSLNQ